MNCTECDRLNAENRRRGLAYGVTARALQAHPGMLPDEYMKLRAATDEARIDSRVAKMELEKHQRVHAEAS